MKKFSLPLVWNSEITKKKKEKIWLSALNGTAGVIVGARSALMIPISNLGLIIVDEEHEQAFKQEENVRYNARDMAIYQVYKIFSSNSFSLCNTIIRNILQCKKW